LEGHRIHDHELILVIEEPVAAILRHDRHEFRRQHEQVEMPRDVHAGAKIEIHPAHPEPVEASPIAHEHVVHSRPLIRAQLPATPGMLASESRAPVGLGRSEAFRTLTTTEPLGFAAGRTEALVTLAAADPLAALAAIRA